MMLCHSFSSFPIFDSTTTWSSFNLKSTTLSCLQSHGWAVHELCRVMLWCHKCCSCPAGTLRMCALQNAFRWIDFPKMLDTEGMRPATHFGVVPLPVPVGTQVPDANSHVIHICTFGIFSADRRLTQTDSLLMSADECAGCSWRNANCHATATGKVLIHPTLLESRKCRISMVHIDRSWCKCWTTNYNSFLSYMQPGLVISSAGLKGSNDSASLIVLW